MLRVPRASRAAVAGVAVMAGAAYVNTNRLQRYDDVAQAQAEGWSSALGVRVPVMSGARAVLGFGLVGAAFGLGYARAGQALRMPGPVAGSIYGVGFWTLVQGLGWAATTEVPRRRPQLRSGIVFALEGGLLGLLVDGTRHAPER